MEQTTKSVLEIEFNAGVDCGNYETEVAYYSGDNKIIRYRNQPSVINFTTTKHPENERSVSEIMSDFFNNLNIYFRSYNENVNCDGYYNVGTTALNSKGVIQNMEIINNDKSSNDIPVIMATTMLAATVLKDYYDKTKDLPEVLNIKSNISTAIPSSEYTPTKAKLMENRLKGKHTIDFYIGNKIVSVNLELLTVKCTEEGKTSMLAFLSFDDEVLKEYNEKYQSNATVSDFKNELTYHIDIGDGTTEFTAIKGVNPIASTGKRAGVGHATSVAITEYINRLGGLGEITRQYFMSVLRGNTGRTPLAQECFSKAVKGHAQYLLGLIRDNYVALTKGEALYFFVHGGGSCVFKEEIYEKLCEYAKSVQGKVVYIPCKYATHMNSTGNLVLIHKLLKK